MLHQLTLQEKLARQKERFRDLVSRGVIDPKTLPHPLTKAKAADMHRRMDELLDDHGGRGDGGAPF
jgi:hypothetical protein